VNSYQEAADKSLQLWALPAGQQPRSLGVLAPGRLLQLPANESDVRGVPVLAVSLEPQDGVPSETGPTGPVLFKGQLIPKML
jgi:anti-sigma-K factor RskA